MSAPQPTGDDTVLFPRALFLGPAAEDVAPAAGRRDAALAFSPGSVGSAVSVASSVGSLDAALCLRLCLGRAQYVALLCAVRRLQARWRGALARARYVRLRRALEAGRRAAAVRLQARWRGHAARRDYAAVRRGILCLQARVRGAGARLVVRLVRHMQARARAFAAVRLQAAWRSHAARRPYALLWRREPRVGTVARPALVRLQAALRGWPVRRRFRARRAAVVRIQAAVRAGQARLERRRRAARRRLLTAQRDIAAFWRDHEQQPYDPIAARAALVAYRVQIERCRSRGAARRQLEAAADAVVAAWRSAVVRREYVAVRAAVVRLQAAARGWSARRRWRRCRALAGRLQAAVRGHLARRDAAVRCAGRSGSAAATVIQRAWRRAAARSRWRKVRAAVLLLQNGFRRHRAVVLRRRGLVCVAKIQAAVQGHMERRRMAERRRHLRTMVAAVTIAGAWRGFVARREYAASKRSILKIQAMVRRHRAVRRLRIQRAAAIHIQSCWRCFVAEFRLLLSRASAVRIQAWHRRCSALRVATRRLAGTLYIQAIVRGYLARCHTEKMNELRKMEERATAATRFQAAWRSNVAQRHLSLSRESVIKIQAMVRRQQAMLMLHRCFLATAVIQSFARVSMARQTTQSLKRWKTELLAALSIEAAWRRYSAQRSFHGAKVASTKIQAAIRGRLCRLEARMLIRKVKEREAVVALMNWWRCLRVRRNYAATKKAAIKIQSVTRRRCAQLAYEKALLAATLKMMVRGFVVLQNRWRRISCQRRYMLQRQSIVQIQAIIRTYLANKEYLAIAKAVLLLQGSIRCVLCRIRCEQLRTRSLLNDASTFFRKSWDTDSKRQVTHQRSGHTFSYKDRQHTYNRVFNRRQVMFTEPTPGGFDSHNTSETSEVQLQPDSHWNVTKIQCMWRKIVARRKYDAIYCSLLKIQLFCRRNISRKRFQMRTRNADILVVRAAKTIQVTWLSYLRERRQDLEQSASINGDVSGSQLQSELQNASCLVSEHEAICAMYIEEDNRFGNEAGSCIDSDSDVAPDSLKDHVKEMNSDAEQPQSEIVLLNIETHITGDAISQTTVDNPEPVKGESGQQTSMAVLSATDAVDVRQLNNIGRSMKILRVVLSAYLACCVLLSGAKLLPRRPLPTNEPVTAKRKWFPFSQRVTHMAPSPSRLSEKEPMSFKRKLFPFSKKICDLQLVLFPSKISTRNRTSVGRGVYIAALDSDLMLHKPLAALKSKTVQVATDTVKKASRNPESTATVRKALSLDQFVGSNKPPHEIFGRFNASAIIQFITQDVATSGLKWKESVVSRMLAAELDADATRWNRKQVSPGRLGGIRSSEGTRNSEDCENSIWKKALHMSFPAPNATKTEVLVKNSIIYDSGETISYSHSTLKAALEMNMSQSQNDEGKRHLLRQMLTNIPNVSRVLDENAMHRLVKTAFMRDNRTNTKPAFIQLPDYWLDPRVFSETPNTSRCINSKKVVLKAAEILHNSAHAL